MCISTYICDHIGPIKLTKLHYSPWQCSPKYVQQTKTQNIDFFASWHHHSNRLTMFLYVIWLFLSKENKTTLSLHLCYWNLIMLIGKHRNLEKKRKEKKRKTWVFLYWRKLSSVSMCWLWISMIQDKKYCLSFGRSLYEVGGGFGGGATCACLLLRTTYFEIFHDVLMFSFQ